MPKQNKIVLIDLDTHSSQRIQVILEELPGIKVYPENRDLTAGINLIRKMEPTIIILNLYPSEEQTLLTAQKICQKFPDAILFITAQSNDSQTIIGAMHAGAREYLAQPIQREELIRAVKHAIRMNQEKHSNISRQGKIISFMGAKGGVGTTTIASNVATALRKHSKKEVILIDLNLQFGNAAMMLDIRPRYTLLDIANNLETLDPSFLENIFNKNAKGVSVLGGPGKPEDAEIIQGIHIEKMLMHCRSLFDYIVIDAHRLFDDVTIRALDESDTILLLSQLDVPSVVNAVRCLKLLQRMDYENEKIRLVLNRYPSSMDSKLKSMEKLFDYPIFWKIPDQKKEDMIESVNKGIPVLEKLPHTSISKNLFDLAVHVNGGLPHEAKKNLKKVKRSLIPKITKVSN